MLAAAFMDERRSSILVAVSLLAAVALTVAWVHSYSTVGRFEHAFQSTQVGGEINGVSYVLFHGVGSLQFQRGEYRHILEDPNDAEIWQQIADTHYSTWAAADLAPEQTPLAFWNGVTDWRFLRLGFYKSGKQGVMFQIVELPFWLFIPMLLVFPVGGLARCLVRERRAR